MAFRPSRQFIVFLLVGGLAAASQWLSRFAFSMVAPYALAVALAYGVGLVIAFTLNRRLVFRSDQRAGGQFARFVLVNALSFAVVWGVSLGLGEVLLPRFMDARWAEALGHGIGILSPVLLSFWLHKHFTFRAKERPNP